MKMLRKILPVVALLGMASAAGAQTQTQFPTTPWNSFAPGEVQCGAAYGVNANAGSTDTAVPISVPSVLNGGGSYSLAAIIFSNASVSLSAATAGVFTGAGGTGTTVMTDAALSSLTAAALNAAGSMFSATIAASTTAFNAQTLYLRVGTAQGAAATFDVRFFCRPLYGSSANPH